MVSATLLLVGYTVIRPEDQVFEPPSWNPQEPARRLVELRRTATLRSSQANLWCYPPGVAGSRHSEPVQEEVFCILEGTLTMFLGEPPERFELTPRSVAVVEPETPLQIRNDSDSDVLFFAYGAPHQPPDYKADILDDV
jgi:mannose-6-phosphate isomerase-like protein (cupin superfamily)